MSEIKSCQEIFKDRQICHIHFVGIGGSGMGGIAEVFFNEGYAVSGSDLKENSVVQHLANLGAVVYVGHDAENIQGADIVVVSTAVTEDNVEVAAARNQRIPVVPRAQMLAELMRFRHGIAIAGTHGKTTTTSLIASILAEENLDPTFVIGGCLNSAGTNARLGTGKYLVAEADESDASFLHLQPKLTVVTNIDEDHMGTYNGDIAILKQTFIKFLHCLPFYGLAVMCSDDPIVREILPKISRPILTYGFNKDADIRGSNFSQIGTTTVFTVKRRDKQKDLSVTLNLPGRHNVQNALAAISVAMELGVSDRAICQALEKFAGVGRRFQQLGHFKFDQVNAFFVDDYGHHPRELEATIQAARDSWPNKRIVMIFQPHRYTRTRDLFEDFSRVLSTPDALLLLDVYSAGESPIEGAGSYDLSQNIGKLSGVKPIHVADEGKLLATLKTVLQDGDVVLIQGAGSVSSIVREMIGINGL